MKNVYIVYEQEENKRYVDGKLVRVDIRYKAPRIMKVFDNESKAAKYIYECIIADREELGSFRRNNHTTTYEFKDLDIDDILKNQRGDDCTRKEHYTYFDDHATFFYYYEIHDVK